MSKDKLIPELRFPDFEKDGEWDDKVLGEICDVRDGTHDSPKYVSEGYPLITSKNLLENGEMDFDNVNYLSKDDYDKINERSKVDINDILFGMIGTIGNPVIVKRDGFAIKNVALIKTKGELNQEYLIQLMKSDYIDKQFQKANAGGILKFIALGMIRKLNIPTPQPREQQKIASCLSSLDELLAAHNEKLDALKDHKKGLMQNLFPQEGETLPKVRFPEFEGDGDWKKKELGDLITIKGRIGYRGYTKEDIVAKGEGAISMSPSNISAQGTLSFEKSTYITWDKYYESPEIMLENGFTVLVKTGSTFGKVAFITNLVEKATINPQLVVLKPKDINNFFLYLIVSNNAVQTQITATVVGGAIPTLSQDSISKFEVMIPKEKEQQKIASCLAAVDELINAQADKIEQLQQHKKGLMQGLFPKIES
ncbi:restriction endonuclease subunit S [Maribacter halichondriae]|uniref:restriction endonuclease subunit S n=1 Tax=Maribacter halichondriae TaxID=2980554 RepID=UPI00235992C0|nr:restriction endonuclease subunit S [Maribacter sp. Hal144]